MIDDDSDLPLTPCSTWVLLLSRRPSVQLPPLFEMPMLASWTAAFPYLAKWDLIERIELDDGKALGPVLLHCNYSVNDTFAEDNPVVTL